MEEAPEAVRWAILGTAGIAAKKFVPGVVATGAGVPYIVGSRDVHRGRDWAMENRVQSWVEGYTPALVDPLVTAVYIPLPNALHVDWTVAALQAGHAVLCEKPLCLSVEETERVLEAARDTDGLLWEAFVFVFHPQTALIQRLLAEGAIGELREIEAAFHFVLPPGPDVRWDAELGGGALNDVGCYLVRLARLLFAEEPTGGSAECRSMAPTGVDAETVGTLDFTDGRMLAFSCGFGRNDVGVRLTGDRGELYISNPFHPGPEDVVEVWRDGELVERHQAPDVESFTPALTHMQDAIQGRVQPRQLAVEDAAGQARALDLLRDSAGLD